MTWVCSVCGKEAVKDGIYGYYLACGCDRDGIWINDGRGGYWQPTNNAHIVSLGEYFQNLEKQ